MSRPFRRLLVIADSDSYVKWGAAFASRVPREWASELVIVPSPVLPSERQLGTALAGSRFSPDDVRRVPLSALRAFVDEWQPDAVLLAVRGPVVRVIVREIGTAADRPVLFSGFPGLTIPAVPKAIVYREQVDLIVLQSRREVRDFGRNAEAMPVSVGFALATMPFLDPGAGRNSAVPTAAESAAGKRSDVVFAVQAKVPATLEERIRLLRMLADAARAQPQHRFVIKVRARRGEAQTHAEEHDLASLLSDPPAGADFGGIPANLVVEDGPMAAHLRRAAALVTISSTAVLEAIAAGIPALLLDDFGVGPAQINTVFEGSGLFGGRDDLVAGRYRHPREEWIADNYFHGTAADDWTDALEGLMARRDVAPLPLSPQRHNLVGGAMRRAFDRRRMFGAYDDSLAGSLAMAVAVPSRWALRRARALKRAVSPGRPASASDRTATAKPPVPAETTVPAEAIVPVDV